jgi:hypothetical protein
MLSFPSQISDLLCERKDFSFGTMEVARTFLIESLPSIQCFSMLCTCFFACAKHGESIKMVLHPLCDKFSPICSSILNSFRYLVVMIR